MLGVDLGHPCQLKHMSLAVASYIVPHHLIERNCIVVVLDQKKDCNVVNHSLHVPYQAFSCIFICFV